jgi:ubiquinone/menaquinone biosynthesis C-methylase UbiE
MTKTVDQHLTFWEASCDLTTFTRWCGNVEPWKEEICDMIMDVGFESVLDIGCGTGVVKEILDTKNYPADHIYVGTEITPQFIQVCRSKSIPTLSVDLRNMKIFKDEEFDCVLCLDVLNHQVEDPRLLLQEMLRTTKKLLIVSFFRDFLDGDDCVNVVHKAENMIYAEWSRKYLTNFLDTLDVSYEWVERKATPGKHLKPASLFIMKNLEDI